MHASLGVVAVHVRDLGLRDASDRTIFERAREAGAVVLTKDADFVALVERSGAPPQILWVTIGNSSEARLEELLLALWPKVQQHLADGASLIEITDRR